VLKLKGRVTPRRTWAALFFRAMTEVDGRRPSLALWVAGIRERKPVWGRASAQESESNCEPAIIGCLAPLPPPPARGRTGTPGWLHISSRYWTWEGTVLWIAATTSGSTGCPFNPYLSILAT